MRDTLSGGSMPGSWQKVRLYNLSIAPLGATCSVHEQAHSMCRA